MKKLILTQSASAGGTIRKLLRSRPQKVEYRVEAGFDDFSHGSLTSSGTVADFCQTRQAFWKSVDLADVDQAYSFDYLSEFQKTIDAVLRADQIEFWCTHTVKDQFYLTVMLHLFEVQGVSFHKCKVRQMTYQDTDLGLGVLDFKRLGEIADRTDTVAINAGLYREAWHVLEEQTGARVNEFVFNANADEPIARAFAAFLMRFPEFNGGLGSIERALLGAGNIEMRKFPYTVGTAMAFGEPTIDVIGDWLLSKRLVELSKVQSSPWFEVEGDLRKPRFCNARLTASGDQARRQFSVKTL
ncbi:DUF1835 domain-containing protein [Yoonia sp. I 8.24]|uniref:DUF1835 domain-containing protein n=1 Tax=Yoonia sp. I 8.24 TaxID=1537229 RepID=UPI001EE01C71|nr:DUF1835 domain-containing protein [Yoonia sp. I 8.24]MCG3267635.1 DUF1835 domain-containing protein [Yoonia sp. I 8.24]